MATLNPFIDRVDVLIQDLRDNKSGVGIKSIPTLIQRSQRDQEIIFEILDELKSFRLEIDSISNGSTEYNPVFKKFTYTGETLTKIEIFTDNTEVNKLYNIDYIYTLDNLTSQVITRISDSVVFTKTYTYDINGNLININLI